MIKFSFDIEIGKYKEKVSRVYFHSTKKGLMPSYFPISITTNKDQAAIVKLKEINILFAVDLFSFSKR